MEAAPSRYAVRQPKPSGSTKWIIPGLPYFTGILEVNVAQPGVDVGSLMNVNKQLIFYGTEGGRVLQYVYRRSLKSMFYRMVYVHESDG